jgi:hypothetical protein
MHRAGILLLWIAILLTIPPVLDAVTRLVSALPPAINSATGFVNAMPAVVNSVTGLVDALIDLEKSRQQLHSLKVRQVNRVKKNARTSLRYRRHCEKRSDEAIQSPRRD